ncbi:hypothetical protein ACLKA6_000277 [Drosophila palustris]
MDMVTVIIITADRWQVQGLPQGSLFSTLRKFDDPGGRSEQQVDDNLRLVCGLQLSLNNRRSLPPILSARH